MNHYQLTVDKSAIFHFTTGKRLLILEYRRLLHIFYYLNMDLLFNRTIVTFTIRDVKQICIYGVNYLLFTN